MNQLSADYLNQSYMELCPLDHGDKCRTFLVKSIISDKLSVKKVIPENQVEIYKKLTDIHHPGLVPIQTIYHFHGQWIVIEDYVSGDSLAHILQERTHLSESETIRYFSQLCQVLSVLHRHNVIHRDINPNNIIISTDHVAKLIDFDISRSYKENQTQDTIIMGTAGYASPEQFGFHQTDTRSDIYAMGVLLNVMLTGDFPSRKHPHNVRYQQIVSRCIAMDPERRFRSVDEIISLMHTHGHQRKCPLYSLSPMPGLLGFIPGFRTGSPWKMIIATILYLFNLILAAVPFSIEGHSIPYRVEIFLMMLLCLWIPALLLADFGHLNRHFSSLNRLSKGQWLAVRICIIFLVFILFCVILFLWNVKN